MRISDWSSTCALPICSRSLLFAFFSVSAACSVGEVLSVAPELLSFAPPLIAGVLDVSAGPVGAADFRGAVLRVTLGVSGGVSGISGPFHDLGWSSGIENLTHGPFSSSVCAIITGNLKGMEGDERTEERRVGKEWL